MTTTTYTGGWFLLAPEGCSLVAVEIDHRGDLVSLIEESQFATHLAARDRYAAIVEAIQNGDTSENVSQDHAGWIIDAWDADASPECVVVERIVVE